MRSDRPTTVDHLITIPNAPPGTISFNGVGRTFLTFHGDGRVTADPDMKPDEAAAQVIDIVMRLWSQTEAVRLQRERDEARAELAQAKHEANESDRLLAEAYQRIELFANERDEARAEVESLRAVLEQLLDITGHHSWCDKDRVVIDAIDRMCHG